jgi:predicted Zn-ribbon and HTH transcriptional regulator
VSEERRTGERSPLEQQLKAKTGRCADPKSAVGVRGRAERLNIRKENESMSDRDTQAIEALMNGLESFQRTMLNKPYDQAIFLLVALREAGLKIVRIPERAGCRECGSIQGLTKVQGVSLCDKCREHAEQGR